MWTVGSKLANPTIEFWVDAPNCLPSGPDLSTSSGPNLTRTCQTTEGPRTFATPALADPFRAPDGRLVPGHPESQT